MTRAELLLADAMWAALVEAGDFEDAANYAAGLFWNHVPKNFTYAECRAWWVRYTDCLAAAKARKRLLRDDDFPTRLGVWP